MNQSLFSDVIKDEIWETPKSSTKSLNSELEDYFYITNPDG